jgi:hypothetical protein
VCDAIRDFPPNDLVLIWDDLKSLWSDSLLVYFWLVRSSNVADHGSSRACESFVSDPKTSCTQEKVGSSSNKYSSASKVQGNIMPFKLEDNKVYTLLGQIAKHR